MKKYIGKLVRVKKGVDCSFYEYRPGVEHDCTFAGNGFPWTNKNFLILGLTKDLLPPHISLDRENDVVFMIDNKKYVVSRNTYINFNKHFEFIT